MPFGQVPGPLLASQRQPDVEHVGEASGNVVLIGYSGARLSPQDLARRAAAAQERLKMKYDLRDLVKARKDVTIARDAKILTDDFAPVEMLKTVKRHNEKRE